MNPGGFANVPLPKNVVSSQKLSWPANCQVADAVLLATDPIFPKQGEGSQVIWVTERVSNVEGTKHQLFGPHHRGALAHARKILL